MTLIIAIKCKDGVVFASDGQATSFSSGGPVRQKTKKIYQIGDILFAAAGTVGVIQRCRDMFRDVFDKFSEEIAREGINAIIEERTPDGKVKHISVRDKIRELVFLINKAERERHRAFYDKEEGAPVADVLIAFYDKREEKFKIWHIAPDGGEEFLEEIGYGCIGIGDIFAHAFIKDYYSSELDIERGKFLAYRIIKDAIEIGAYGLGEPIDIWTMKITQNGNLEIRNLTKEEIMALNDTYIVWKDVEKEVFERVFTEQQ
jgi:20S proteasome alpha/beta subunit